MTTWNETSQTNKENGEDKFIQLQEELNTLKKEFQQQSEEIKTDARTKVLQKLKSDDRIQLSEYQTLYNDATSILSAIKQHKEIFKISQTITSAMEKEAVSTKENLNAANIEIGKLMDKMRDIEEKTGMESDEVKNEIGDKIANLEKPFQESKKQIEIKMEEVISVMRIKLNQKFTSITKKTTDFKKLQDIDATLTELSTNIEGNNWE